MRLAIDTNRYVELARGNVEVTRRIEAADWVFVPFAVLAELRAGFLGGNRSEQNEARLIQFLGSSNVSVLFPDEQTTHHFARLYHQLRTQGTPIPAHDIWIAALVLQHNVHLYARDRHFDNLPQIPRV